MIEFCNVNISFKDKKIFEDFNFKINKGDKVLLNAPSGSGKSTLFKLLLGFLKPDYGIIKFNEEKLDKNNIRSVRSNISYVSQDIEFINEKVDILIHGIFSYEYNKNKNFNNEKLKELLEYFELNINILEKKVSELSGGERQRIGLIIAIFLDREVLLLDEITSALDYKLKQKVVEYITTINKTVLVISHDEVWKQIPIFKAVRW
ncbi:ABC transporter ATP-binding protein [Clostridium aestuarii]|uniref:ABC transporter ATP-binding protein n=1 Tax=Clostridium aestuarii TaxID=338193 RepID=A0ABT4D3A8_9CLOT|nr:ABC transporter ATP-binding protein [Clostridium aestuarii]